MEHFVPFGGPLYFWMLAALAFGRGMDFFSTWLATPNLLLEANPIARWLGWKLGIALNILLCLGFALWPLPAIVITTSSLLVAARNLQSAWLMRLLGEEGYRGWMTSRLSESHFGFYVLCLFIQAALIATIGVTLAYFSFPHLVPFAIGIGILTYAVAVVLFTLLSVWRIRRALG